MASVNSICLYYTVNKHYENPSKDDNNEENLCGTVENFDFGTSLLSTYDVFEQVLEYLSYIDLCSLSKLGSNWAQRIEGYMKKRLTPHIFYFSKHPSPLCKNVGDCTAIKPSFSITFFNDSLLKLHYYVCMHRQSSAEVFKKPVVQFIEEDLLLNEKCPMLAISCKQNQCSVPQDLHFNGTIFPSIPGVNISVIRVSKSNKDQISTILDERIGANSTVNCLLAFTYPLQKNFIVLRMNYLLKIIQKRQLENFAFGGGLVTGIKTFNTPDPSKVKRSEDALFVIFSTPKNMDVHFDAYSIKITEEMIEQNEVDNVFIEFKKYFKKRKNSVALRFSCTSLDESIASVMEKFLKHFPGTGISGFSCNGEIGWDKYKEEVDDEPSIKKPRKTENYVNYFTIIFVILSWGKLV